MPHPEQPSTPASSPDGGVATTAWPMPAPQPAGQKAAAPASKPISAADLLQVARYLREEGHIIDGALADRVADFLRQHCHTIAELSETLSRCAIAPGLSVVSESLGTVTIDIADASTAGGAA